MMDDMRNARTEELLFQTMLARGIEIRTMIWSLASNHCHLTEFTSSVIRNLTTLLKDQPEYEEEEEEEEEEEKEGGKRNTTILGEKIVSLE